MTGKIGFGVDYLHTMLEMDTRSHKSVPNTSVVSKFLLVLEWGFTTQEVDQASKEFWEKVDNNKLDNFGVVADRLLSHLKDNSDAKSKLLADLILVTQLDEDLSDEERDLLFAIASELDFRKSEVLNLVERANQMKMGLDWFSKNYNTAVNNK